MLNKLICEYAGVVDGECQLVSPGLKCWSYNYRGNRCHITTIGKQEVVYVPQSLIKQMALKADMFEEDVQDLLALWFYKIKPEVLLKFKT